MTTTEPRPGDVETAPLPDRLLSAVLGSLDVAAVYLGDRLGWYRALAGAPATAPELAARTGTDARYAREWLEHQAVGRYLIVEKSAAPPRTRGVALPSEER